MFRMIDVDVERSRWMLGEPYRAVGYPYLSLDLRVFESGWAAEIGLQVDYGQGSCGRGRFFDRAFRRAWTLPPPGVWMSQSRTGYKHNERGSLRSSRS